MLVNKPLLLLVGPSGCGKTTVANYLEINNGYSSVQSYSTRPKRYDNETGHIFITDKEFNELQHIVAYTEYNGYKYCATEEQIDKANIYIVDVPGVKTLLKKYHNQSRPIYIFYLKSTVKTRIDRMLERDDHDSQILSRLYVDEEYDWFEKLNKIVHNCKFNTNRDVRLHVVDANKKLSDVAEQIMWYIK